MPYKKKRPSPKPAPERGSRGRSREGALFTTAPSKLNLPTGYAGTLHDIKEHLRSARVRAMHAANPIVIDAYWHTGKIILQHQSESAWGAKVIDRLAADLREEFPDMGGLTTRNLLSMKIFAREFPGGPIAKQPVSQLPWGHILSAIPHSPWERLSEGFRPEAKNKETPAPVCHKDRGRDSGVNNEDHTSKTSMGQA